MRIEGRLEVEVKVEVERMDEVLDTTLDDVERTEEVLRLVDDGGSPSLVAVLVVETANRQQEIGSRELKDAYRSRIWVYGPASIRARRCREREDGR